MFCRKCGTEIPDDSIFCLKCGTRVEMLEKQIGDTIENIGEETAKETVNVPTGFLEGDTPIFKDTKVDEEKTAQISAKKKLSVGHMIGIVIGLVLILGLIIIVTVISWQNSLVNTAKNAYDNSDYETAYNKMDSIFDKERIADYETKIKIMYNVDREYRNWKDHLNASIDAWNEMYAIDTLAVCIGYSQMAKESGCDDKVDSIAREVVQWLANRGKNIEFALNLNLESTKYKFAPLAYTDEEALVKEISRICNMVSQDEVTRAQNEENPLKIVNCDAYKQDGYWYCTGTVSNVSETIYDYVKVRVTYYDESGTVLTTDWTYAVGSEGIRGGENQQFEMMTKVTGTPEKYKVEIMEDD